MSKLQKPFDETSGCTKGCFVGGCAAPVLFCLIMVIMALTSGNYSVGQLWALPLSLLALEGGFFGLIFILPVVTLVGAAIGAFIGKVVEWLSY